ncbi:hypothetical protein [Saccharopolyspora dendranthemae]|uniref:Tol biopolymer transport system component n=1 Tax=Saccharopolyspora dendranthemae TaxID=1181886 RepID=A0A561U850_9PSEU|nr:hypothetical protein [Saccharopolyspora dendranthemae]TWF95524.1 Tol biopolymer transport system component [Saccharopolyspora dendranthemae]
MVGEVPGFRRGTTRWATVLIGVLLLLCGLISLPTTSAQTPVAPVAAPEASRIAYAGTEHRSLGIAAPGLPGQTSTSPLFDEPRQHFDQEVSSRDGLLVFTSLRDERTPQVYLRDTDGEVRRLTRGMDAAHPELSPDLQWVAFDSAGSDGKRDIWLVRVDGSRAHRLADTANNATHPTFSPDGTRIAFACDAGGRWQIYDQPASGGALRRLTDEQSGSASEPSWNPADQGRIAYTHYDADAPDDDAVHQVRVLDGTGTGTSLFAEDPGWQTRQPSWLPDGRRLLFLSPTHPAANPQPNASNMGDQVFQVDASSAPVSSSATRMLSEDRRIDSPTWLTGNGVGRLVVARTTASSRNVVRLQDIRSDGVDPRDLGVTVMTEDPNAFQDSRLIFTPSAGYDPWTERQAYSPDGSQIAVSRFEDSGGQRVQRIWLVNADGSNPRRLPIADRQADDWESDVAWAPDGESLAVARRSPGALTPAEERGRSRIVVVDVDSGQITKRLGNSDPALDDTQPAWSPDGKRFSFSRGRVSDVPDDQRRNHIWIARADDLGAQQDLSDTICQCEVVDDSPVFAPDGRSIVFNRERDGLYRIYLDGNRCEVLLPRGQSSCVDIPDQQEGSGTYQPRDATWSPDGKRLVLSRRLNSNNNAPEHLSILDPATREVTSLSDRLPGRQKEPSWQATVDLTMSAPQSANQIQVDKSVNVTGVVRNNGPATSPSTTAAVDVPEGVKLTRLRAEQGSCGGARCDLGVLEPGQSVRVTAELVGESPGDHALGWTATGSVRDSRPGDNTSRTVVPVRPEPPPLQANPIVSLTSAPDPSYVGGRTEVVFSIRNGGEATATGLELDVALPPGVPVESAPPDCVDARCPLPDLPPGGVVDRRVVLAPNAALAAEIAATVRTSGSDSDPGDNRAAKPYRVLQPRIVSVPEVGEPGFVTSVRGVDFPPGAPVRLAWSPGITASAAPTLPGPDGRFAAQLLILPKDETGPRTITASGPGFSPVTARFLVVAPAITPPGMVGPR